ncbi:MAG: hypothetical protein OEV74_07270 [Cyclobacteriaceae bacterium]|nr:hypothetical protein [Cyclobacteriaceae bacterium]MDH4296060.1 hypothetical protein [Cyclobacteriaceae bacterium]
MKKGILLFSLVLVLQSVCFQAFAQLPALQYYRTNDKGGLNVFEPSKNDTIKFEGIKVRLGGDFAIQFQGLRQTNALDSLVQLGSNFNLPSANFNIDVQLAAGLRMHLRTYLSSRHHPEAWVKGGYIRVDNLDFIKPGFLSGIMDVVSVTVGLDEFNYGDAHFRRSDNARTIFNPFVGNYIMDSFSTEIFGEATIQKNGFLAVLGFTNGKLNQSVIVNSNTDNKLSFYGKAGYDSQINDDLRVRLTASWYINKGTSTGTSLYGGDRAGGRYYDVLKDLKTGGSDFEGRFNPAFKKMTAVQVNPFLKFKGLEFFGIYEMVSNAKDQGDGSFTQLAGELLYRFGKNENLYIGGRYNSVNGKTQEGAGTRSINRVNVGGGWFITKNILTKVEYVSQKYDDAGWAGTKYNGATFDGFMVEATIGF